MIEYFSLLLAIPLGILLATLTKHEKHIYKKSPYFPLMIWALLALSAIFLSLNKPIALTLLFMTIMTIAWSKA